MDSQPITGQWMIVELLGHNVLYGLVSEEQRFGVTLGRCEVPTGEDTWLTRWFGGGAIFRLTPTDEETARRLAGYRRPLISQFSAASPYAVPAEEPDYDLHDDGGFSADEPAGFDSDPTSDATADADG